MFVFDRLAFAPVFEFEAFAIGVLGGAIVGAGVAVLAGRFAFVLLVAVLFEVVPPHPMPRAPIAKTAVIAILFIILTYTPVFSKICYGHSGWPSPMQTVWNKRHYKLPFDPSQPKTEGLLSIE